MTRKTNSRTHTPPRVDTRATRETRAPKIRLRLPRSRRVVTARLLARSEEDRKSGTPRRNVPEIRLSGAWLDRIGFAKGRRYLISVDRGIETIYLQAEAVRTSRKR